MKFSDRSSVDSAPSDWSCTIDEVRRSGRLKYDLTESNPTQAGIDYDQLEILSALSSREIFNYQPEPFGLLSARRAVADWWKQRGQVVDPAQIILTASTSEAYGFLFKLLGDPGDEVLAPRPSYPLFEHLARYADIRMSYYDLRYDGAWYVDIETVQRRLTRRTRAILVVSPNNPTGSFLKKSELAALTELGVPLVCDEVFSNYPLRADPRRAQTVLEAKDAPCFVLNGLSKLAGLPQMKLGWMTLAGPRHWVKAARARLELMTDTYLSVSAPIQHALPRILANRSTEAAIRERTGANLKFLHETLEGSPGTVLHVEGGWTAIVELPRIMSEEAWVQGLLQRHGALVNPGWFYDFETEPLLVVSLLTSPEIFQGGISRLQAHLRSSV